MAKETPKKSANEMSFFEHIEELRWHLLRAALSVLVVTVVVFLLKNFVFQYVILGPTSPDFITYRLFCEYAPQFCFYPEHLQIITRDIQEQFLSHIKVSLWLGFIVAFPYILFEVWRFIRPGLYKKEIVAARGMVFVCSFLFLAGVSFGYFIITPIAVTFLSSYSVSPDIANTTTLAALVNSITMFTIPVGLIFETPVILYFLAKIGLVSSAFLIQYRKHSFVFIIILAAIITPSPDVFSQMLVAIPLYMLYEVSIIVVKRIDKERAAKEASESLDANSN
ncbi:MAG TPA: twin-arginine translocase subunit TatC [Saprospiraceae bacterium]|nr:twin-arginine translocase subunit TatC [Saprospiraceae bacterium]HQW26659.1 twin-arginine translocase subunit TatC [Saprospiraceae bacterium]